MNLHTLKNGIRVITEERKNTDSVFISVTVDIGSNHETEEENGLAHFFEHMCFKGTKKFPRADDLSVAIDKTGAHINAHTSKIETQYHFWGEKDRFNDMATLVADIFLNSIFPKEEMEKEKGVIIQEIQMYKDMAHSIAEDELHKNALKGTPAARTILGTEAQVKKFTVEDFLAFRKKHYKSKNIIITVVGNVNEKTALPLIEELFDEVPTEKKSEQIVLKKERLGAGTRHSSIVRKQDNQMVILIGFPFPTLTIRDRRAAEVLNTILGVGFSSRLFLSVREKAGACYSIGSGYHEHEFGIGAAGLEIQTGIDSSRVEEVTQLIKKELDVIKKGGVTEDEMEKARTKLITALAIGSESNKNLAQRYVSELIGDGEVEKYENIIDGIKRVTVEEVGAIANTLLKGDNSFIVYVGNREVPESISQCLREL